MNRIIKVYGYQRSGNNYLCALLYKNFYNEMPSVGRKMDRGRRRFFLFGEEIQEKEFFHPYHALVGSHDPRHCSPESIYIIRNREDAEKSLAKRKYPMVKLFPHWMHVYAAIEKRPYIVYYEDLKAEPEKILHGIQQHFNFNRLYKNFIVDIGYCGWPE